MLTKSARYVVFFGLASGLAMAIAPASHADIPVTGGRTSGNAAFFVPNTGNTVLFDAQTRTLRLETPNGVTVNSRFTPVSGSLTGTVTGVPKGGENGILQGTLAGRAFSATGTPVFFQGVPTTLNFQLSSFNPASIFGGTLITSKQVGLTPQIFLPFSASLDSQSQTNFEAKEGSLYSGQFAATLPSGKIGLDSNIRFAASNDTVQNNDQLLATGALKFKLEGKGEGTTTYSSGSATTTSGTGTTSGTTTGTTSGTTSGTTTTTTTSSTGTGTTSGTGTTAGTGTTSGTGTTA